MSEPQLDGIPKETVKELKNKIERLKAVKAYLLVKLSNCETYLQGMTNLVNEIEATYLESSLRVTYFTASLPKVIRGGKGTNVT